MSILEGKAKCKQTIAELEYESIDILLEQPNEMDVIFFGRDSSSSSDDSDSDFVA